MNAEQREHRVMEVIHQTAQMHGVEINVVVGEYEPTETGFVTHSVLHYRFNRKRATQLRLLIGVVFCASGYLLTWPLMGEIGIPWAALPMCGAIILHHKISKSPKLKADEWNRILVVALQHHGFSAVDKGDTLRIKL